MKRKAYAKKRDANEPEIVLALRKVGAKVVLLDWVDLMVCYKSDVYLLEVKTDKGKLTADQEKNFVGWPIHIVRCPGAALLAIGVLGK
jgi:hypothetical protein